MTGNSACDGLVPMLLGAFLVGLALGHVSCWMAKRGYWENICCHRRCAPRGMYCCNTQTITQSTTSINI